MSKINIAIDGPAGAGKSTLAKAIANALHIYYLDTGSMYRAVAYAAIKSGVDIGETTQVEQFIERIDLHTVYQNGEQQILMDGKNVMFFLRTPEMSKAASDISVYPCVRRKLVAMQRDVAQKYDVVLDGRDIGTYVLPNAKYKYFVTADVEERAKRRHLELQKSGCCNDYNKVLDEIIIRDTNDTTRSFAPLRQADDAILINTTSMRIDEVLESVLRHFRKE